MHQILPSFCVGSKDRQSLEGLGRRQSLVVRSPDMGLEVRVDQPSQADVLVRED